MGHSFLTQFSRSLLFGSQGLNYPAIVTTAALFTFMSMSVLSQSPAPSSTPVIVQPGAPGQVTRVLPSTTRAKLPPRSTKDIEFMQGMIMHHAQAVEMTAMIDARTTTKELILLGLRIKQSQADEMNFMRRWLTVRGQPISQPMPDMDAGAMAGHHHHAMMPGMLSQKQMDSLKAAKGAEFDRLFLEGMIQHHQGALEMVEDLFGTAGAGQDAELFNFATDVDSGQRAEIKIMQNLLGGKRI